MRRRARVARRREGAFGRVAAGHPRPVGPVRASLNPGAGPLEMKAARALFTVAAGALGVPMTTFALAQPPARSVKKRSATRVVRSLRAGRK
jgi:hypothetical protein